MRFDLSCSDRVSAMNTVSWYENQKNFAIATETLLDLLWKRQEP